MFDITVADKLATTWFARPTNSDPEHFFDLLRYEWALPGVSDGGAHTRFLTAGRWPTEFLIKGVRDNEIITLEQAHWRMAALPARCAGFVRSEERRVGKEW